MMNISGLICEVIANYLNGVIVGQVNTQRTARQFKFEFAPMRNHSNKQIIFIEIKRLYFIYRDSELVLDVLTDEEIWPANDFNLLDSRMRCLA